MNIFEQIKKAFESNCNNYFRIYALLYNGKQKFCFWYVTFLEIFHLIFEIFEILETVKKWYIDFCKEVF